LKRVNAGIAKRRKKMQITRTIKCTVPSGINYSNTDHFLSMSTQTEDDILVNVDVKVNEMDNYLAMKGKEFFDKYLNFRKETGAEGHRVTIKHEKRVPHVTDILAIEYPPPPIANLEEYGKLGSACDRLWKNFRRTEEWVKEDFKDSGLIKNTYQEVYDKSSEWWLKNGKGIEFSDDSGECYSEVFGYIGEYDIIGTMDGASTLFDVKITKDLKNKKTLTKYLCQLAAYAKCFPDIEQVCIISPFNDPVVEGDIDTYFGKFLMVRGKYQERFGI
jgi:hypothetical protein